MTCVLRFKKCLVLHLIGAVVSPPASVPAPWSPHVTTAKTSAAAPGPPSTAPLKNKDKFTKYQANYGKPGRAVGCWYPRLICSLGHHLENEFIRPKEKHELYDGIRCIVCNCNAYLDLAASEEWLIKCHGSGYGVLVRELHIGKTLRVPVKLVAQDRHLAKDKILSPKKIYPVDRAAAVEVLLKLLSSRTIVNVSWKQNQTGPGPGLGNLLPM